ncbi:hypothetical protein [Variovorax sp.]|uniref:hypothetical protein n=1 Tax=Variovorax sp. TaxID=1871043 RepID=UPI003BABC592
MTVAQTPRKAGPYAGNGVATTFTFGFKVFTKQDIAVVRTNTNGIEATLTVDSDYSVLLNADQDANPGGTITYPILGGTTPLPIGWRLTMIGALAADQETDITNTGRYLPNIIENSLDKLTILVQQALEQLTRSVQVPVSSDTDPKELIEEIVQAGAQVVEARDQVLAIAEQFGDVQGAIDAATDQADIATAQATVATTKAALATTQAGLADAARAAAELAADAAAIVADIYPNDTEGLAATTSGQYFKTPSPGVNESLDLKRNVSGVAIYVKSFPSSEAVLRPVWMGVRNGWVDTFFRYLEIQQELNGRPRWFMLTGASPSFLSLVPNVLYPGSRALQLAANSMGVNIGGPIIYPDEIGAAAPEKVTVCAEIYADAGAVVTFAFRASDEAGNFLGAGQEEVEYLADSGSRILRKSFDLPTGAARINVFPYTVTADKRVWTAACWAYKGDVSAGPPAPSLADEQYMAQKEAEQDARIAAVESISAAPEIVVPPYIYGVQGRQANVYTDNMHVGDSSNYNHRYVSSYGQQLSECWRWTPSGTVTDGAWAVRAHDKRTGAQLVSKSSLLRAAAANAGAGQTIKVCMIGHSIIYSEVAGVQGRLGQALLDIAAADDMGLTLIGARGPTPENRHEGRGGYTIPDYTTAGRTYRQFNVSGIVEMPAINASEYGNAGTVYRIQETAAGTLSCSIQSGPDTPPSSGTLTKTSGPGDATIAFSSTSPISGNPFFLGGQVDVPQYFANQSFATPDWVPLTLDINDLFPLTSDAAVVSLAATRFNQLDTLIASVKDLGPSVRVALTLPILASHEENAFGLSDQTQYLARYKRNNVIWGRELIARYQNRHNQRIYLMPVNLSIDTINNAAYTDPQPVNSRSDVLVKRQKDSVHPGLPGYGQMADAMWSFFKFYA